MSAVDPIGLIGNLGFPIAMCLLVYWDLRKQIKDLTNAVKELCTRNFPIPGVVS